MFGYEFYIDPSRCIGCRSVCRRVRNVKPIVENR